MELTRRRFLAGSTGLMTGWALGGAEGHPQLPLAFSTLGCPAWDLAKIVSFARQNGFAAVELRGLEGNLDLPTHPAFAPEALPATKRAFADAAIQIACVSSSARMGEPDPAKREKELADARRFIDLASKLNAPYVRVFADREESDATPTADQIARVAGGLQVLGEYAGPKNVIVILESHDNYTRSATLREVLTKADSKYVGLLWDAHHTFATAGEDPEYTVKQLGPWIRHVHLKDSIGTGKDRKYVLTGHGNVPIRHQIAALRGIGYKGFYCFEWEKVWHPDLEAPEIAIADYSKAVQGYF